MMIHFQERTLSYALLRLFLLSDRKCVCVIEKPIGFPQPLTDMKSACGFFVTFACEHDHPRAEAYWTRDGEEIEKSDKFEMSQDGNK